MYIPLVFLTMLIFLFLRIPIAIILGIGSILILVFGSDINLTIVIQRIFSSTDSFTLLAIPFFMLAGEIMTVGGISKRLVDLFTSLIGSFKSGLGAASITAATFFAALSGSNAATVAAVGSVMTEDMHKNGYPKPYIAALIAAGGVTGSIIPPSVLLILYGATTGTSIGDLFIAGLIPGILISLTLIILNAFLVRKYPIQKVEWQGTRNVLQAFKRSVWGLIMPFIVLGGIYTGVFTPTESAAVAVGYGLIIGLFVYKDLKFNQLPKIFLKAVYSTVLVMFIMSTAGLFGWVITSEQLPQKISLLFTEVSSNEYVFLILVNILLLIVGMFMNAAAAIAIFTAILFPAAQTFGIDPILFGIIITVNLSIGTVTPPLGVDLFVASSVTNVKLEKVIRASGIFILFLIVDLLIITFFPPLSTFLVALLN